MSVEITESGNATENHELTELATEAIELNSDTECILPTNQSDQTCRRAISYLQIVILFGGIVISLVFFAILTFVVENHHGGTAALISGIIGSFAFYIHLLDISDRLEKWYDIKILKSIQMFALVTSIFAVIAMSIYLYFAIMTHEETIKCSFYPSIIFIFLIIIWNFQLFWLIRRHKIVSKKETEK